MDSKWHSAFGVARRSGSKVEDKQIIGDNETHGNPFDSCCKDGLETFPNL